MEAMGGLLYEFIYSIGYQFLDGRGKSENTRVSDCKRGPSERDSDCIANAHLSVGNAIEER
jgi:hypothetical protein